MATAVLKTPETKTQKPYSAAWVARSVFSNWFGLLANLMVGFLLAPFVVHHLGNTAYGIWALVLQLTGYLGVVDVGLRSALVRFVSRLHAQKDRDGLSALMSTTLMLYLGCAGICLIAGLGLAVFAPPLLHIPGNLLFQSRLTIVIASVILSTDFAFAIFQGSLAGLSRWDLRNLVAVAVLTARAAATVLVLRSGRGLVALALVQLLSSLAGHFAEVYVVHRLLPDLRLSVQQFQRRFIRPVGSHSLNSFLIALSAGVNYEIDAIVIAAFLPVSEVTYYVIGFNLVRYLRTLINASSMIVAPLASHLEAEGTSGGISELFCRGTKYVLLLGYLGCAALLCFGTDFIRVWMGNEYAVHAHYVIRLLTLGLFFSFTENIGAHVLFGLSRHRVNVWCTGAEGIVNLAASLILVRRYGIYGVAAGTMLAAILVRGWFFPQQCLQIVKVRWQQYLRVSFVPTLVPTVSFLVGGLITRHFLPGNSYGALAVAAAGGMLLWIPALVMIGLDHNERQQLLRQLDTWLRPGGLAAMNRNAPVAIEVSGK